MKTGHRGSHTVIWKRGMSAFVLMAAVLVLQGLFGVTSASAVTLTVCASGCPYTQIAPAIAAAHSGDRVNVAAGTYLGGFTIDKNLTLNGAGAQRTIISGGDGSVVTIGSFGSSSEPTVSISGVTITGGLATSSPESIPFFGVDGQWAAGGGVEIPPGLFNSITGVFALGAAVSISNSVITANIADPTTPIDSGIPCPGFDDEFNGDCPFALALGGGIDSYGALTLFNTTVSNNFIGGGSGVASDADGAGISDEGSLTLLNSTVSGNEAVAASPDGRFAEGGGIDAGAFGPFTGPGDSLTVKNSSISDNSATLTSDLPSFYAGQLIVMAANTGGLEVNNGVPTAVENSVLKGNTATADDLAGEPTAFDAAMNVNASPLVMSDSQITDNKAITETATSADSGPSGSALEVDGGGTITNSRITDNYALVESPSGEAQVNGAVGVFGNSNLLTIRNSTISGNTATATSTTGSASMQGAGVFNDGLLELIGDQVADNNGTVTGPSGEAQGGGVFNGDEFTGPPVHLILQNTAVTRNSISGPAGSTLHGGGLFTAPPATLSITHSVIVLNTPDQCFGCLLGVGQERIAVAGVHRRTSQSVPRSSSGWRSLGLVPGS